MSATIGFVVLLWAAMVAVPYLSYCRGAERTAQKEAT